MKSRAARRLAAAAAAAATGAAVFSVLVAGERDAAASNVLEFPDNGSEQMARGGAWVARASDPLAAYYNPAGLAGQPTRLTLDASIVFSHTCFTRVKSAIDETSDGVAPGASYPRVCNDIDPFPNPQLGYTYRVSDRVGVGLAVLGPSAAGTARWPEFVGNNQPAPQRYLETYSNVLLLTPTLGIGAEVAKNLRLGASFQWGIMKGKLSSASPAINGNGQNPASNDIQATIIVGDYFVPGFTLGGIYTVADKLDIAGWYKWSDSIKASGDVYTQANYYSTQNAKGNSSGIIDGDSSLKNCNYGSTDVCGNGDNAKVRINIPMEAKLGFRYHQPRGEVKEHSRDPMSDDVFDAEVDLTWANNSSFDYLQVRFPGDANGNGIIPVNGAGGGAIPPDADLRHHFYDVIGVRAGGDYNIVPEKFTLRGGAFFESKGQDTTYQGIDYVGSAKVGVSGGAAFRIITNEAKKSALDLMIGYMHVFYATENNNDPNAVGLRGLAGSTCNPSTTDQNGPTCTSGIPKYRTSWPVNLGTITNAVNVINVGASYKF